MEPHFRPHARTRVTARRKGASCRSRSVYPDASDLELSLFIQSYLQEFKPRNEDESAAVESMVRAQWLKRCLWKLEDDLFSTEIRELRLVYPDAAYNTLLTRALARLKRLRKKNKIAKRT